MAQENKDTPNEDPTQEIKAQDPNSSSDKIQELQLTINHLNTSIDNIRATALKSEKQYSDQEKSFKYEIAQKQNRIEDLEKDLNQLRTTWLEKSQQMAQAADNKEQFEKIIGETQVLEATVQKLQTDNQSLRASTEQQASELSLLKNSEETLIGKNHLIKEMETEIRQKLKEIETLKNELLQYSGAKGQTAEFASELIALREQLKEIQIVKFDLLKERDGLKIKLNSTSSHLQSKTDELELLKSNIEHYQSVEDELLTQQIRDEELTLAKKNLEHRVTEMLEVKNEQGKTIIQLQDDILEIQKKLQETKEELGDKNLKVEDLISDLDAERAKNLNLREEFQSQLDQSDADNLEMLGVLNPAGDSKIINDLRSEITNYETKMESMIHKDRLLPLQREVDGLKSQLQNKDSLLNQKEDYVLQNKSDFDMEREAFNRKIEELNIRLQYVDNLQENLSEKNSQIGRLQDQLDDFAVVLQENERLRVQFNEVTEKVNTHIEQKNVLFVQIKKLKDNFSGEQAIVERLEKKINDLQGKGFKENIELDMLRKRVDDLNLELRHEIMKASEAKGKYDATKEQMDHLYPQIQSLQNNLMETERNYKDEVLKMSTLLQHSENEVMNNKREMQEIKDKYKDVKLGGAFKEEIEQLMAQIDDLTGQNIKLDDGVKKTSTDLLLAKKENNRLIEEKRQLKRRIKLLRRDFGNPPE